MTKIEIKKKILSCLAPGSPLPSSPLPTMTLINCFENIHSILSIVAALCAYVNSTKMVFYHDWEGSSRSIFIGILALLAVKRNQLKPSGGRVTIAEFIWGWMFLFSLLLVPLILPHIFVSGSLNHKAIVLCCHMVVVTGYLMQHDVMRRDGRDIERGGVALWVSPQAHGPPPPAPQAAAYRMRRSV